MSWVEILIIVLAAGFVLGVGVWQFLRRKKGKGGCDCCSDCSRCGRCGAGREREEREHSHKSP